MLHHLHVEKTKHTFVLPPRCKLYPGKIKCSPSGECGFVLMTDPDTGQPVISERPGDAPGEISLVLR